MTIATFLEKLKRTPNTITFSETISVIEENYDFIPTAFENGTQHNAAGENSGSCKLFAFAKKYEEIYQYNKILSILKNSKAANLNNSTVSDEYKKMIDSYPLKYNYVNLG